MSAPVPMGVLPGIGVVEVSGLLAQPGVLEVLVSLWADEDARNLLDQAAQADGALEGDPYDADQRALAEAHRDDAYAGLGEMLRHRSVPLDMEAARSLRDGLAVALPVRRRVEDRRERRWAA